MMMLSDEVIVMLYLRGCEGTVLNEAGRLDSVFNHYLNVSDAHDEDHHSIFDDGYEEKCCPRYWSL